MPVNAFWSSAYRTGKWNGKFHLFNYKTQVFPTGCMTRLRETLKKHGFESKIKDIRNKPEQNETWELVERRWDKPDEDLTLRWFQLEAISFLISCQCLLQF